MESKPPSKQNKLGLIVSALIVVMLGVLWAETAHPKAPAKMPAMNAQSDAAKTSAKPYPFAASVVSGQKLAGTVVAFEQDGYQVKLLNQTEADTFKRDPAPYLAKIKDAYQTAKPYPLTVCAVLGDPLDKDAYSFVYEGRQFKLCCDSCLDDFQKDPDKFVKVWDAAEQAKSAGKQ